MQAAALLLAFLIGSSPEPSALHALRAKVVELEASSTKADARAAGAATERDEAQAELERHKRALRDDGGGFFAERRVRSASAVVHEIVEKVISMNEEARIEAAKLQDARRDLRSSLFAESSRLTAAADAAARQGRTGEAAEDYGRAASLLREAAAIPRESPPAVDSWQGLEIRIPDEGIDAAEVARIYRGIAAKIEETLVHLERELESAESASAAWERLSRFRGVLERAGATNADPRPGRDALRDRIARGRTLHADAIARARMLEAKNQAPEVVP